MYKYMYMYMYIYIVHCVIYMYISCTVSPAAASYRMKSVKQTVIKGGEHLLGQKYDSFCSYNLTSRHSLAAYKNKLFATASDKFCSVCVYYMYMYLYG